MLDGLSPKQIIDVLVKWNISLKQLFLLWIMHQDRLDNERFSVTTPAVANVYRFVESVEPWTVSEIIDLVRKGLLEDINKEGTTMDQAYPDHYRITFKFTDELFASEDRFDEFWDEYPSFVENFTHADGPKIPLKACMIDEVEISYKKKVRTLEKHKSVMKILIWAKKQDLINMNIAKYIGSKMYDQHMKLKDHDGDAFGGHRSL